MNKQKRWISKCYQEKMKSENGLSLTSHLLSFTVMFLCSWGCYRDCFTMSFQSSLSVQGRTQSQPRRQVIVPVFALLAACVFPFLFSYFISQWVCHSGRLAFEVLISSTSCSPSVVKWYVRTRARSHWRICFLLSSQTTHLISLAWAIGWPCIPWSLLFYLASLPITLFPPYSPPSIYTLLRG